MAKDLEAIEGRLARVTAQLEQAAKRQKGGGLMGALRPFALGAAVGAGLALLYAPQPGEKTRALLRRNADDLQDRAMQVASSAKEQPPEQAKEAQANAQALLTQTKAQARTAIERGKDASESGTAAVEQALKTADAPPKRPSRNGVQADDAQSRLQRDLETGRENPA